MHYIASWLIFDINIDLMSSLSDNNIWYVDYLNKVNLYHHIESHGNTPSLNETEGWLNTKNSSYKYRNSH